MGNLYAPNGAEIIGTLEILHGCAGIIDARPCGDGTFDLDHDGETEIYWNGQETVTDAMTQQRIFIGEDGMEWQEGELTYKETEDDQA